MANIVRRLFVIVGALLGVVVTLSLIRGAPLLILTVVPLMLVLLMSAVPVALTVMFTFSMAVGSRDLAKRVVLVTRLSAAEADGPFARALASQESNPDPIFDQNRSLIVRGLNYGPPSFLTWFESRFMRLLQTLSQSSVMVGSAI